MAIRLRWGQRVASSYLAKALALLLVPWSAMAACNPPAASVGSIGCQPSLGAPQGSDLILAWRPSLFPNSLGQYPLSAIASGIDLTAPGPIGTITPNIGAFTTLSVSGGITAAGLPTSCAGELTGALWNNGNVVSICP